MEPSPVNPVFPTNGGAALGNTAVTPEGRRALWGGAIGYAMDGFDLLILGFMLRQIGTDLNLNAAQAASLVTVTLIGAVVGGLVFGLLSDRLGLVHPGKARRRIGLVKTQRKDGQTADEHRFTQKEEGLAEADPFAACSVVGLRRAQSSRLAEVGLLGFPPFTFHQSPFTFFFLPSHLRLSLACPP